MKYSYVKPAFSSTDVELESAILEGSYTGNAMMVNKVVVDEFDPGFVDDSGAEIPFKDINFE